MTLDTIATSLRTAEATSTPIAPIREQITSAADAYAIQDMNTEARLAAGGRLVGRKIGLTNPAVQAQLGVDQPDYGMLFADMDLPHNGELAWNEGAQWKAEAELAFVLKADLVGPGITAADVLIYSGNTAIDTGNAGNAFRQGGAINVITGFIAVGTIGVDGNMWRQVN